MNQINYSNTLQHFFSECKEISECAGGQDTYVTLECGTGQVIQVQTTQEWRVRYEPTSCTNQKSPVGEEICRFNQSMESKFTDNMRCTCNMKTRCSAAFRNDITDKCSRYPYITGVTMILIHYECCDSKYSNFTAPSSQLSSCISYLYINLK